MTRIRLTNIAAAGIAGLLLLADCGGSDPTPVPVENSGQTGGATSSAAPAGEGVAVVPGQDAGPYQIVADASAWLHPGYDSGVGKVFDLPGQPVAFDPGLTIALSYVADADTLKLTAFDLASGEVVWKHSDYLPCLTTVVRAEHITCVNDAGADYELVDLDVATGEYTVLRTLPGNVWDAAGFRDGMVLLRVDRGDESAAYWLIRDGEIIWTSDAERQYCVLLDDAVGCYNNPEFTYDDIAVWSVADGALLGEEPGPVNDLFWASDGYVIDREGTIEMLDTSGAVVGTLDEMPYELGADIWDARSPALFRLADIATELQERMSTSATFDAEGNVVIAELSSGQYGFLTSGTVFEAMTLRASTASGGAILVQAIDQGAGSYPEQLIDPTGKVVHDFGSPAWLDVFAGVIVSSEDGNQTHQIHLPAGQS